MELKFAIGSDRLNRSDFLGRTEGLNKARRSSRHCNGRIQDIPRRQNQGRFAQVLGISRQHLYDILRKRRRRGVSRRKRWLMLNGVYKYRLGARIECSHSVQIGLDCCDTGAQACRIDLQIFHDALNVITRLSQWYALHPIDCINIGIPRVTVLRPLRRKLKASTMGRAFGVEYLHYGVPADTITLTGKESPLLMSLKR